MTGLSNLTTLVSSCCHILVNPPAPLCGMRSHGFPSSHILFWGEGGGSIFKTTC